MGSDSIDMLTDHGFGRSNLGNTGSAVALCPMPIDLKKLDPPFVVYIDTSLQVFSHAFQILIFYSLFSIVKPVTLGLLVQWPLSWFSPWRQSIGSV